ncbi:MAG: amidohydrolase family protein [Planctomycetes bacterium]|nr:amidohydrolase family protein [Planctomycetota bacterium]
MTALLLRNAVAVRWHPASVEPVDLRIDGDTIVERAPKLSPRGETVIDLEGRVVIAGMVCAHTHLYSTLARGMPPPPRPPQNFREILETIWWRVDRALDLDMVEASAATGALDAVACGTTTLFDHHASPSAIEGSLERLRRGITRAGARAVLCYEVTDRGGPDEARRGLAEHRAFLPDARFRLAVGAHASFTLEESTLAQCGELARELDTGVHIHVAEDPLDTAPTRIYGPRTILAHAVHLSADELRAASEAGCWFVHNPRSNMNNHVGYAPVAQFPARTALGTDGIGADMFAEARFAAFKARDAGADVPPERVLRMLQAGHELASEYFGRPFGTLAPGSVADLAILDYDPPTPLTAENLAGHLLFGMDARHVSSVLVEGDFVLRERRFPSAIMDGARAQARRLWQKLR